jgi:hypothetical protein
VSTSGRAKEVGVGRMNVVEIHYTMYDNRTMKPVEIVLRRREEGRGEVVKGVNWIGIDQMHVWKYHNETPFCATSIY